MNEYVQRFDTRPCTQVSVLELQGPVSRIRRPVAGLRRSRVVSPPPRGQFRVAASFPAIDTNDVVRNVRTSNWTSDGVSINPMSRLTMTSASIERYRPKTSSSETSALLRRKASGKSNLLNKLQTMSLERTGRDEEEGVVARFARFEPLPAIGHPSSNLEGNDSYKLEVGGENEMTDSSVESSSSSDISDLAVATTSTASDVRNSVDAETFENRLFENVDRSRSKVYDNDDDDDEDLSVDDYREELQRRENETQFAERPATSYLFRTSSWRPLVRSQTYDILPNGDGGETALVNEIVDGESVEDSDSSREDLNVSKNLSSCSERLLLVMRTPWNDDNIYGYFRKDDTLRTVLDYTLEKMERIDSNFKLAQVDDFGDVQYLDLTKTIRETKLWNRSVLDIIE